MSNTTGGGSDGLGELQLQLPRSRLSKVDICESAKCWLKGVPTTSR